jgi:uncharacterized protein YceK
MKSLFLAVLAVFVLSGCGTLNTYVAAQNAAAVKDTKAANDNLVRGIEESICEVPIGAVIRNSEFVPIAQAACLPAGANQNPVQLLQNMAQPATATVPAYQQNMNANPVPAPVTSTPAKRYAPKPQKPVTPGQPLFSPSPASTPAPAPTPAQPFGALTPTPAGFGAIPGQ